MTGKQVIIYSTPTCPYCKRAKDYFTQQGIPYIEHNVAIDRNAAKEMIKKSGQMGVPVITINDEIIVGFNQAQLDKLLHSNKEQAPL
jgi:glutaredoxin-like YruB-family protein